MDLTGHLKNIKNALNPSKVSLASSDGSIEIKPDYGCQDKQHIESDTCAVCLEKNCNTMLLPCSHQFHADCIIQWTERQFSCPMCRTEISHFVPLRSMKSNQHAHFVKLWENHYMTSSPQKDQPAVSKVKSDATYIPVVGTMKRTASMGSLKVEPDLLSVCKNCDGSLKNEFVYFAFDHKFCSTPCRLTFARAMPRKKVAEETSNSHYVDYTQLSKYMFNPTKRDEDLRPIRSK